MVNYTPKTVGKQKTIEKNNDIVKDFTIKLYIQIKENDSIIEVQKKLLEDDLTGFPVVNDKGEPVGFLSQKDCLTRILKMQYFNDVADTVKNFMSTKCLTISEDDKIIKGVTMFSEKSLHIIPVVNSSNIIVGILTRKSVFKYMLSLKQQTW